MTKCSRMDCASGLPGRWTPVLVFRPYPGATPAHGVLSPLVVCDRCREAMMAQPLPARLHGLVTDEGWRQILQHWPPDKARPRRDLTDLGFTLAQAPLAG